MARRTSARPATTASRLPSGDSAKSLTAVPPGMTGTFSGVRMALAPGRLRPGSRRSRKNFVAGTGGFASLTGK